MAHRNVKNNLKGQPADDQKLLKQQIDKEHQDWLHHWGRDLGNRVDLLEAVHQLMQEHWKQQGFGQQCAEPESEPPPAEPQLEPEGVEPTADWNLKFDTAILAQPRPQGSWCHLLGCSQADDLLGQQAPEGSEWDPFFGFAEPAPQQLQEQPSVRLETGSLLAG